MALPGRRIATALGWVFLALEVSDIGFVVWARPPIEPHIGTFVILVGLGTAFLWWSRSKPTAPTGSPVLSPFWTVVALVVGSLLVTYAALIGLLLSLVFSPDRALQAALVPWGIVGLGMLMLGLYRVATSGTRVRASNEVQSILARVGTSPNFATESPSVHGLAPPPLAAMQSEIVDAVRASYRVTSPTIRFTFWTWYVAWFVGLAIFAIFLLSTVGVPLHYPGGPPITPVPVPVAVVTLVLLGVGVVEGGFGIPARLRGLEKAEADLDAGRPPDDWMLMWWFPFRYTARLIELRLARGNVQTVAAPESSVLATSLAFLRFGRRLAWFARYWYTTVFVLLLIGIPTCTFVSIVVAGHDLAPEATELPSILLLAGWAAVASLLVPFAYLYRRYRTLDPISHRLAVLEAAEVQLERTLWSRF